MPRLTGEHAVRALLYVLVLLFFLALILASIVLGLLATGWHERAGRVYFLVAAGLFLLMFWILARIAATKDQDGQWQNSEGPPPSGSS